MDESDLLFEGKLFLFFLASHCFFLVFFFIQEERNGSGCVVIRDRDRDRDRHTQT